MNQIVKMFDDSNKRMKQIMSGKYNREIVADACREFNAQIKLINGVIQAYGVSSKNKRVGLALEKLNLLDDESAISLGVGASLDNIKCPDREDTITREECLDISGSQLDECSGCHHFATTRKLLVGPR